jgi:transcriptional pleiotropic regulator of transition state genes
MTSVTSGIERKVDGLGRIVIPAEMRERFGLREGDHVDIAVRDGAIVVTPMQELCASCGRPRRQCSRRDR